MTTKISELPTGQAVGNIIDETVRVHSGATTAATPSVTLERSTSDSSTNTVPTVLRLKRTTTGTPAAGIGACIDFEVETSTGNNETLGSVAVDAGIVTPAGEFGRYAVKLMHFGAAPVEVFRLYGGAAYLQEAAGLAPDLYVGGAAQSGSLVLGTAALGSTGKAVFSSQTGAVLGSGLQYGWHSSGTGIGTGTAADTGLGRHSAGVTKATNGSTTIHALFGGGAAIASAATLPVPTGRVCHVTGTTGITNISATNFGAGVAVTLIFDGALTLTDGGNMKLAGNFTTTADDTLSLIWDGTNWYETGRSVN